jgi:hypothetical protein
MPRLIRSTATIAALAGILACCARPVAAQEPAPRTQAPVPAQIVVDDQNAGRTRDELMRVLEKYPPSVGRVLKLDPSLLANRDYLATYPSLAAFLAQHPDVQRDPAYYFDRVRTGTDFVDTRSESYRVWNDLLGWIGGLSVATLVAMSLGWIIRLLVDYRRWYRLSKVQAEAHNKLLDRMTANEELLAYVQSSAGSRFLESAPIALDPGNRRVGAPFSRILWSAQAGVVLTAAGLGFRYMGGRFEGLITEPLAAVGILLIAIGVGFLVSAGVSYVLSRQLGLLDPTARGAQ